MPVGSQEFRAALGHFASSVNVVTARTADGQLAGITVTAFCSLSLEPPLVVICIDKRARLHEALAGGQPFAVNMLSQDQEVLSRRFAAQRSRPVCGRRLHHQQRRNGLARRCAGGHRMPVCRSSIPVGTTRSSSARWKRREFGKANRLSIFAADTDNWHRPADRGGLPIGWNLNMFACRSDRIMPVRAGAVALALPGHRAGHLTASARRLGTGGEAAPAAAEDSLPAAADTLSGARNRPHDAPFTAPPG